MRALLCRARTYLLFLAARSIVHAPTPQATNYLLDESYPTKMRVNAA